MTEDAGTSRVVDSHDASPEPKGAPCAAPRVWCGGQCVVESALACGPSCAACAATSNGVTRCQQGACVAACEVGFDACVTGCCVHRSPLAAGEAHTCVVTPAGGVKCWGSNFYGQLGNDSRIGSTGPVDVKNLAADIVSLAAGADHTCALSRRGMVQCWGSNRSGQLGTGTFDEERLTAVTSLGAD